MPATPKAPSLGFSQAAAERWVVASAAITAAIYFYRLFTEGSAPPATLKRVAGQGKPVVPIGAFATAWGFTYFVLAVMAQAAPSLGGSFAILIATGDVLTNIGSIVGDVTTQEKGAGTTSSTTPVSTAGLTIPSNPLTTLPHLQATVPLTSPQASPTTLHHQAA